MSHMRDYSYLGHYYHKLFDACEKEDLTLAEKILNEYPDIDISINQEFLFHTMCKTKKIKMAQWLLNKRPNIDISALNEYAFRVACSNQDIDMAKWLYSVKPDINISFNNEEAFISVCSANLELAQWLLSVKPDINISAQDNKAFIESCKYCCIPIAKWLISLNPDIIFEVDQEMLFKNMFIGYNKMHIDWFVSIAKLDKKTYDWAFLYACRWGTLDIVDWVLSKKPYSYFIKKDETGMFVLNYYIRSKEDEKWESRKYAVWLSSNQTPNKNQILYCVSTDVAKLIIGYI